MYRICFEIASDVGPKPKYNTKPENVAFYYKDKGFCVIHMMDWNHMFGKISRRIVDDWAKEEIPKLDGFICRSDLAR